MSGIHFSREGNSRNLKNDVMESRVWAFGHNMTWKWSTEVQICLSEFLPFDLVCLQKLRPAHIRSRSTYIPATRSFDVGYMAYISLVFDDRGGNDF